jgi:type I restriction enzyme, S subunit
MLRSPATWSDLGTAASENRATVGDYVTLVRGTTYQGVLVGQPGPALLGLGSIEPGGGFRIGHYKTYGGDCPDELMLFPGDTYASLKGATKDGKMIGSVARVPGSVPEGRLTQDTVKLVFRSQNQQDASYLYWILRTPQYREYCAGHAMGSAVVALSRRDFLSYPVPPQTDERRAAVALFDAIEERVDVNRRMSETLEAIARTLFRSRFAVFDPDTPARVSEGALADIAWLNPESWSKETRPPILEYVDLANTKWGRIETTVMHDRATAPSRAQRVLRLRDTIIGTVRPGNGSYAFVTRNGLTGSTGFAVLRPKEPAYAEFVYLAATDPQRIDELAHLADGAAYPAVRPDVVAATPALIPTREGAEEFSKIARPILDRVALNEAQSRTLAALRDTLLPKLISDELRIGDAEGVVEAAT